MKDMWYLVFNLKMCGYAVSSDLTETVEPRDTSTVGLSLSRIDDDDRIIADQTHPSDKIK